MLIRHTPRWALPRSETTPRHLYMNRREIMTGMGAGVAAMAIGAGLTGEARGQDGTDPYAAAPRNDVVSTDEEMTSRDAVTSYNNFYEFGTDKSDPARYADAMQTDPWSVRVDGNVANPGDYALDDLIDFSALEERVYRLRCVEAWSMVIPWIGVPLGGILRKLAPTSKARYVQFETLLDRDVMRGVRRPVLDWPYVEGLRLDEAAHPLAFIAVGLYDSVLPNQNGAPLRLVVPWKYGFKSIKSIVAMRFVEDQPKTSWNESAPREYGFYANVNPEVDHPRWSQANERRIGDFFRRDTLMFNGYANEVAGLYSGMDLARYF